jgi:hypothetical protein
MFKKNVLCLLLLVKGLTTSCIEIVELLQPLTPEQLTFVHETYKQHVPELQHIVEKLQFRIFNHERMLPAANELELDKLSEKSKIISLGKLEGVDCIFLSPLLSSTLEMQHKDVTTYFLLRALKSLIEHDSKSEDRQKKIKAFAIRRMKTEDLKMFFNRLTPFKTTTHTDNLLKFIDKEAADLIIEEFSERGIFSYTQLMNE